MLSQYGSIPLSPCRPHRRPAAIAGVIAIALLVVYAAMSPRPGYVVASLHPHGPYFAVRLSVGSRTPIAFTPILDTGSGDTWVPATRGQYDPAESGGDLLNQSWSIAYDSRVAHTGFWSRTTVSIGGTKLAETTVAGATDDGVVTSGTSGMLGIGVSRGGYRSQPGTPAFLEALVRNGVTASHAFSLNMDPTARAYEAGSDPVVVFGAVDASRFDGPLIQYPIWRTTSWYHLRLDGIRFGSASLQTRQVSALLDSGTIGLKVPFYLQQAIAEQLGATLDHADARFPYSCDSATLDATLDFTFAGNVTIRVPVASFVGQLPGLGCRLLVTGREREDGCTLGAAFLRGAYIVFDRQNLRIAIAQAASDTGRAREYHVIRAGAQTLPLAQPAQLPSDYFAPKL